MFERALAIDVETSGLDPARDELVEVGAALWEAGRVVERFESLCRPRREVPLAVLRLTGLDREELARAPEAGEALAGLDRLLRTARAQGPLAIVLHNAPFDLAFLGASGWAPGEGPVLDTLELARILWPVGPHSLGELVRRLGGPEGRRHRAGDDAAETAWLFGQEIRRAAAAAPELRSLWVRLLSPVAPQLAAFFAAAADLVRLLPADPKSPAVAWVREADLGALALSRGEELSQRAFGRPLAGTAGATWDARAVAAVFGPEGRLAQCLGGFEWRAGQKEMAAEVAAALERDEVALIEAGTGTGKSLAYLVPALAFAAATGERVVVATHTLALQDQLLTKDLPVALAALGRRVPLALQKGQTQYLCHLRWKDRVARDLALSPEERRFYARIASWLAVTGEGDRAELHLPEDEERLWQPLVIEEHACLGRRCPEYGGCYVMQARRRAAEAGLVVANHALVFTDLAVPGGVLPPYARLVLDEAHHVEELAAEHLGLAFERSLWQRRLLDVYRPRDRARSTLLGRIAQAWREDGRDGPLARAEAASRKAASAVDAFFETLAAWANPDGPRRDAWPELVERRLPASGDAEREKAPFRAVREAAERACAALDGLARALAELARALAELGEAGEALGEEARKTAEAFAAGAEALSAIVSGAEGWASWFEWGRGREAVRAAPVDVGRALAERLFTKRETVVLTSATLFADGRAEGLAARLGLGPWRERLRVRQVASPFDFRSQALLGLPEGLPRVPQSETAEYWDAVLPFVDELLRRSGGGALLLFTSHRALRQAYARLRPALEAAGLVALAQGVDGGRSRLLQALRDDPRTVLFGAASFWEGIDVPGAHLRLVVVMRLPFRRPNQPYTEARSEAIARAGGDPFRELALPEAVLRFKQGFGRLIRTRADRGAVVCLDDRMWRTPWGWAFLAALPGASVAVGPASAVARAVGDWLLGSAQASAFPSLAELLEGG